MTNDHYLADAIRACVIALARERTMLHRAEGRIMSETEADAYAAVKEQADLAAHRLVAVADVHHMVPDLELEPIASNPDGTRPGRYPWPAEEIE